ncbi:ras-related protein Rab-36 isoform X15 [Homo sapiens]|uniref:ras-related protein Rab-36 isoform X15 n=1 Tax=Homo sapiens TaxID=9606 RepID=UPI0005CFF99C|nr:ras-related protein Rab-36 isoform X15 [Homo sapiens]XP_054182148.1 ras-related protein Rab-36 isoform X15 [Homo sapiens]|eukprot:XP_011528854.1 ras-related protein Rab-36 isoform X11 [Homo sapiens]
MSWALGHSWAGEVQVHRICLLPGCPGNPESYRSRPRHFTVIITAFDLTDVQTLEHTRQWLEDALRENEAGSCFIFLVGTKKDLLSGAACEQAEADAVHLAREMQAEYWREREGILQPRSRPGIRAVGAAGPGEAEQCPAPGRQWRPNPNGRESARDPGEQEALQPGLLLTGACVEGLRSLHTHGQEFP